MAQRIACEKIDNIQWSGGPKTCFMNRTTSIHSTGTTIASTRDGGIEVLMFDGNKKIFYLPKNSYQNFPNLMQYSAWSCSIKSISKDNFKNLSKLKMLYLNLNQIERINSDTFVDLPSLEQVFLRNNFSF